MLIENRKTSELMGYFFIAPVLIAPDYRGRDIAELCDLMSPFPWVSKLMPCFRRLEGDKRESETQ